MTGFDKTEVLVRTSDGRHFTFAEPLTFTHSSGESWTIAVGASCDGASSPREIWPILPPFGKYWRAAALHDDLYRRSNWPKEKCDAWFWEAMEWLDVPKGEKLSLYQGVHLLGGPSFQEDRKQ